MFYCKSCGKPGYGLLGTNIAIRKCLNCHNTGCDKCLPLIAITKFYRNRYITSESGEIWDKEGYCSKKCLKNGIKEGKISLETFSNQEKSDNWPQTKYYYEYFLNDKEMIRLFQKEFFKIITKSDNIQKFENFLNEQAKDSFLAQGLLMMLDGHKNLDYKKIIKGLQLCRNDTLYHGDELAQYHVVT